MLNTARTIEARVQLARAKMNYFVAVSDELAEEADRHMREALELAATALELSRDLDFIRVAWVLDRFDTVVETRNYHVWFESATRLAESAEVFQTAFQQFVNAHAHLISQRDYVHISSHGSWAKELPGTIEAVQARQNVMVLNTCHTGAPSTPKKRSRLCVARLPVLDPGQPLGDTTFSRSEMYGDDGR